jgi:ABC-2 type transport system ATP-binding protein
VIEAIDLTSSRRGRSGSGPVVVDHVSFDVYPGQVTALLGAPGSGKSTVLRMMAEQEPAKGRTLFGGRPYHALRPAVREVGLALDPDALHPGRTVQSHLRLYSAAGGVPKARIAEVLEIAGLTMHAHIRCGRLDPGQRQRLAIAAALLGDPSALLLDEPRTLDAHGMTWFHALIRAYAAQGRTVLVAASHAESLAGTADHVVVLRRDDEDGRTRVIASRSAAEVFDEHGATVVVVRSPQAARLAAALEAEGATLATAGPGALEVRGLDRARIGEIAHVAGICLHELAEVGRDDDAFFGIRPTRKEIAPAPIELVDAGDVAVGFRPRRTGWHSGVRLVAEAAEIGEAEIVEEAGTGDEAGADVEPAEVAEADETAAVRVEAVAEPVAACAPTAGGQAASRAGATSAMPTTAADSTLSTAASPAAATTWYPQRETSAPPTAGSSPSASEARVGGAAADLTDTRAEPSHHTEEAHA